MATYMIRSYIAWDWRWNAIQDDLWRTTDGSCSTGLRCRIGFIGGRWPHSMRRFWSWRNCSNQIHRHLHRICQWDIIWKYLLPSVIAPTLNLILTLIPAGFHHQPREGLQITYAQYIRYAANAAALGPAAGYTTCELAICRSHANTHETFGHL